MKRRFAAGDGSVVAGGWGVSKQQYNCIRKPPIPNGFLEVEVWAVLHNKKTGN